MNRPIFLILAVVFAAAMPAAATVRHIPADYSTIQAGIDASIDGDTVLVSSGDYIENINFMGKGIAVIGEQGALQTNLSPSDGSQPVVSFSNWEGPSSVLKGFSLPGVRTGAGIYCLLSSPTICDNIIYNQDVGISIVLGGPIVKRNEISGCSHTHSNPHSGGAICMMSSSNALIDSNLIHNNFANNAGAIYLKLCNTITISHNQIYSNTGNYSGGVAADSCSDIKLYSNTIVGNSSLYPGLLPYTSTIVLTDGSIEIKDNIIAFNNEWGIDGAGEISLSYCDFFGNDPGNFVDIDAGPGCRYRDPLFVDRDNYDFHLMGNSTCINAGCPASPYDPDGTRADMGALYAEPGYIRGIVTNHLGYPVTGAYITAIDSLIGTHSLEDGSYSLRLPGNFAYEIHFSQIFFAETLVTGIQVWPGDTTTLNMVLVSSEIEPGHIAGSAIDTAGNPVAGAIVIADYSDVIDTTDTSGEFFLSYLRPRSYTVSFIHPDYLRTDIPNVEVTSGDTTLMPPTALLPPPSERVKRVPEDYPTIQLAIFASHSGDTVLVGPGVYRENISFGQRNILVTSRSGPDSTMIISAYPDRPVVAFLSIVNRSAIISGFTIDGDSTSEGVHIELIGAYPTVYGNIIRNATIGIKTWSDGTPLIRKNEIYGCHNTTLEMGFGGAIYIDRRAVVDSNIIHDNTAQFAAAICCYNYALPGRCITIDHNLIYNNYAALSISAIYVNECDSVYIRNNTITNNSSFHSGWGAISINEGGWVNIENNIIAFNTEWGINSVRNTEPFIAYNDIYGNLSGSLIGVTEGPGNIYLAPGYVNINSDFRLLGLSPCIDAGDPASPLDPDGTRCDMGVYYARYLADYGFIAGTVTNDLGIPIENADIFVSQSSVRDTTDAQGRFSLGGFPPDGIFDILISHFIYAETTVTGITVTAGDTTHLSIALASASARGSVAGVVSDPANIPVAGVIVRADTTGVIDTTDNEGRYLLPYLRPQPHNISFSAAELNALTVPAYEVPSADTAILNITMSYKYMITYGNKDRSPMPVLIGSQIEIPVWGVTQIGNYLDSVIFVNLPLSTSDEVISSRLGGTWPDTLVGQWFEHEFLEPNPDTGLGWTNQSMVALDGGGGLNDTTHFLCTDGDTMPLCTFYMTVADDPALVGDTICPFRNGNSVQGPLLWGLMDGIRTVTPHAFFSSLCFIDPSQVGYIAGTVINSELEPVSGLIVTAENSEKCDTTSDAGGYVLGWFTPGNYNLKFHKAGLGDTTFVGAIVVAAETTLVDMVMERSRCIYRAGDVNNSGTWTGQDVTYSVRFFKGGNPPPYSCECTPGHTWYVAGDVNGSCTFTGQDVTRMVLHFKSGVPSISCSDCPPIGALAPRPLLLPDKAGKSPVGNIIRLKERK